MKDDESEEGTRFADGPSLVSPLLVEPVEEEDGRGVGDGDCDWVVDAEQVVVDCGVNVERSSETEVRRCWSQSLR